MIALAESVSHGCNTLRYITGETPNKEHPERVFHIYNNLMPDGLDAHDMWDSFKITLADNKKNRLKNSVISLVLSPSPEEAKKIRTDEEWKKLGLEYLAIFDSLTLHDEKGKMYSEPTNILDSKFTMWEHEDSKSGVHHLHIAALRIDMNGNMNNDHQIMQRAQRAADILAQRRGWMTAKEVRKEHLIDVEHYCSEVLCSMPTFNIDTYFNALRRLPQGYTVEAKRDSNDNYVSYVICDGKKRYPASSIGKSRKFTVKHLEETWKKLREAELARLKTIKDADEKQLAERLQAEQKHDRNKVENKPNVPVQKPCSTTAKPLQQDCKHRAAPLQSPCIKPDTRLSQSQTSHRTPHDYTRWKPDTTYYDYTDGHNTTRFYLPSAVMDFFESEFDYTTILNWDDLTRLAVGLFVEVVLGPEVQPTVGTGGGSSDNSLPHRKDDEDDLRWARRCARYATHKLGKTMKGGRSR